MGVPTRHLVRPVLQTAVVRRVRLPQSLRIKLLVMLERILHVDDVRRIPLFRKQPLRHIPREPNQRLIMRLRKQEYSFDFELQLQTAELLRQVPNPHRHLGQLFLRQESRMHRRSGFLGLLIRAVRRPVTLGILVYIPQLLRRRFALLLKQRVDEAGGVLALFGLPSCELGGFGEDDRGFAPVGVLGVEDDLGEGELWERGRNGLSRVIPLEHAGTPNHRWSRAVHGSLPV